MLAHFHIYFRRLQLTTTRCKKVLFENLATKISYADNDYKSYQVYMTKMK